LASMSKASIRVFGSCSSMFREPPRSKAPIDLLFPTRCRVLSDDHVRHAPEL
jgi:hypothetical protein